MLDIDSIIGLLFESVPNIIKTKVINEVDTDFDPDFPQEPDEGLENTLPSDIPDDPAENSDEVDSGGGSNDEVIDNSEGDKELPEKELIGYSSGGNFFTLVRKTNDNGDIEDVIIQDAAETELFSAKAAGLDFNNIKEILNTIIHDLEIEMISADVIQNYKFLEDQSLEDDVELEDLDSGVPPAEVGPGDVGGEMLVSDIKNESVVNEGMKDVLKKAGVDIDSGHWFDTGAAVYFRGVMDDVARSISEELVGMLQGTVVLDNRKFYKVVLEAITNYSVVDTIADFLKADTPEFKKAIEDFKNTFDTTDNDFVKSRVYDIVYQYVSDIVAKSHSSGKGPFKDGFYPDNNVINKVVSNVLGVSSDVKEGSTYQVIASGFSDKQLAQTIASQKNGHVIEDPEDNTKYIVVSNN